MVVEMQAVCSMISLVLILPVTIPQSAYTTVHYTLQVTRCPARFTLNGIYTDVARFTFITQEEHNPSIFNKINSNLTYSYSEQQQGVTEPHPWTV